MPTDASWDMETAQMNDDLLANLAASAQSASDDIERWTYLAQRACALARLGRIETAREEISTLRSHNASYAPRLSAWIFLAEGLCDHFESLSTDAADRFKRAHGLAAAIGDAEIRSLAAAWIGASEFLMGHHEAAALRAAEAIQHAPSNGALALSRAHLVLANCLYGFGVESLASRHYAKARRFAVEARDISMQSAILYNVAAFHLWRLSFEDAFCKAPSTEDVNLASLEVSSIGNLDQGLQIGSLQAMVPLLRAQLSLIRREWAEADAIYSDFINGGVVRLAPRYLAEQAHCNAMLNRRERVLSLVSGAQELLDNRTELDDRATCHARLSTSLATLGFTDESNLHADSARKHRSAFAAYQERLRPRLVMIAESANPKR